jgi:hypothetical protein
MYIHLLGYLGGLLTCGTSAHKGVVGAAFIKKCLTPILKAYVCIEAELALKSLILGQRNALSCSSSSWQTKLNPPQPQTQP